MLSEGLYSDKMMAVIREVLCNAHDAHVSNNCLDIPIKITLNGDKLIISDCGKGIHDDAINSIYCVYGNSTKTHNGKENGGFGLGSKAPFAYTTHFTVISKHAGRKIIYAVSRGSSETQGKPDMREMANVPTTETGLEVSLPIGSSLDVHRFESLIKAVTYFGEMNVELNGTMLDTLPFSDLKEGFLVVDKNNKDFMEGSLFNHRIYVRYGTVIYPIEPHEDFINDYNNLTQIVDRSSRIFIIQAEPNTIAVTPSRESLSLTNRTRETLKGLISKCTKSFTNKSLPAFKELLEVTLEGYKAESTARLRMSVTEDSFNPHNPSYTKIVKRPLTSAHDIAMVMMITHNVQKKKDSPFFIPRATRYDFIMAMLGKHDPEKVNIYRALKKIGMSLSEYQQKDEITKNWNKMTLTQIKADIPDDLKQYFRVRCTQNRYGDKSKITTLNEAKDAWFVDSIFNDTHFTVAHNLKDFEEASHQDPNVNQAHYGFLIPRKKDLPEKVEQLISKMGCTMINGCYEVEKKEKDLNVPKRPKGYARLSSLIQPNGEYKREMLSDPSVDRINNPLNVFFERTRNYQKVIYGLDGINLNLVNTLVPNAVVVSNPLTYQSLIKKGAFNGIDSIVYAVKNVFLTEPSFLQTIYDRKQKRTGILANLQKFIDHDKKIASFLGGKTIQSDKIEAAIKVYEMMEYHKSFGIHSYRVMREIQSDLENYKQEDPLVEQLNNNALLAALDLDTIYRSLVSNSPHAPKQMSLLYVALG